MPSTVAATPVPPAPATLFDVFRQPDVAGPPHSPPSPSGSTLTHLGPDDPWTPSSPQPGTWHESSIWNETDVFLAQLTRVTGGAGAGADADVDWTMKIGRGGQLYSLTLGPPHDNGGELLPPQDNDVSPWTDDCFVTTMYDTVHMDGDPPLHEFGMNWLQNGYYVKPDMDPILQGPFYEPALGENFNASEGSYSTVHVRFTSQPSIHRSDGIMYNRYRDLGDGAIEVTYYFYNFGDGITQDSLTFPWGGVRTSKMPDHLKGNADGTYDNYGSRDVDGYHVKDSGGWLGCAANASDPDGVALALVHGVDQHYMRAGHKGQTPITSRIGDTNPTRDFTTMATYYDHPIRPGESYFFRTYVVVGSLGDVGPKAADMVDSVDYGHVVTDESNASRLKIYVTMVEGGQTILTTEAPTTSDSDSSSESEPIGESYAVPVPNSYPLLLVREVESGRYVMTTDPYVACSKSRFDNPYEPGNRRYERYRDRVVYRPYDGRTEWVGLLGYLLPPADDDGGGTDVDDDGRRRLASSVFDELGVVFVPGERMRAHELSIRTTSPDEDEDDDDPPRILVDPITASPAKQGVHYEDTIVGTAEDADGDVIRYDKILGPSWLVVSSDGTVGGIPGPTDAGLNTFAVRATSSSSSSSGNGGGVNRTDVATLRIDVESSVDVVVERCSPGVETWTGCFPTLSGPSSEDYVDSSQDNEGVSVSVSTDKDPVSVGTSYLVNGVGQGFNEDVTQSVFFDNPGVFNRILVDLGKVVGVTRIDTYSWHVDSRIEQRYDLYYYSPPPAAAPSSSPDDGDGESCNVVDDDGRPPDSSSAVRSADLARSGWVPLAAIRATVEERVDTQVGVSVRSRGFGDDDVLMRARYVLFDLKDSFTLFGEFDVYAREEAPPPPPPAPPEVEVVMECNSPGVPDWHFHTMAGPSPNDCADSSSPSSSSQCADDGATVSISVTTDNPSMSADVAALLDGFGQSAGEDVRRSVFFDADEPNRILLDLGRVRPIRRVNTYSWHINVRANQVYDLYYYGDDAGSPDPPPSGSDVEGAEELEGKGWIPLASVETEYPTSEENQLGVSVGNPDGEGCILTEARYLLFDVKYRYTVYGEFDVYVNSPPKFVVDPPEPILRSVADLGVPYTGTIADKATDSDGDTLTYEKLTGPPWLTVGDDGTLRGTPQTSDAGSNVFEVRVSDGCGGSDESSFTVLVPLVEVASEVTVGRNSPGRADWTFDSIDGPSASDYADASSLGNAKISVTTDDKPKGAEVTFLLSGSAQSRNEDVWHSVFFDADEPNRVLIDLGDVMPVVRVNTYSWHINVRANQVYDLYYYYGEDGDGDVPPASGSDVDSDSLVDMGWRALASVNTKYPTDVENQVGVSVRNPLAGEDDTVPLTYARFLLFDIKYRYTVYGEFDVYVA